MMKRIVLAIAAAALLAVSSLAPARAQFADQATYAGTGAGSANAQTITISNATSYADLVGVLVKFIPGATNTAAATLNVNGFGSSPSFRKPNGAGVTALTGGEIVSGQPTYVMYDGTYFNLVAPALLPVGAANFASSASSFGTPTNLQINATVATNALTIAVKGNNGSDPSATNPVLIPFRDSTIANGGPKVVSLQSALSFTIASGNTMGCQNAVMCRLWIVAICSTGLSCTNSAGSDVVGLCAFNATSVSGGVVQSVAAINEAGLQTSASGTSGGNNAQTYYCSISAVTSRAIRILGYVEIQEGTAGTWTTGPTYVQLMSPTIKRPGDRVQAVVGTSTTAASTASGVFAYLSTQYSLALTPTSAANPVLARMFGTGLMSAAGTGTLQLVRNGTPTVVGVAQILGNQVTSQDSSITIEAFDLPNTTSQVTYSPQGKQSGGTFSFPPSGGGISITLEEIMGALEPDNDDALATMVG